MIIRADLEFRRYEEYEYDFVAKDGKRVQGTSKVYVFLTEDDKVIKVKLPKDSDMRFGMKKGDEIEAVLGATMKPFVDKESGRVDESNFAVTFELRDIIPYKHVGSADSGNSKNSKSDSSGKNSKVDSGVNKLGGVF